MARTVAFACVVGQVLAAHRRAAGRTQGWVCLEIGGGLSQANLSRIECGVQPLPIDRFAALARLFGVTPSALMLTVERASAKLRRHGVAVELRDPAPEDVGPEVVRGLLALAPPAEGGAQTKPSPL